MEEILDHIQRAYYDGFITNHQKSVLIRTVKEILSRTNSRIHNHYMFLLEKVCNIKINYKRGVFTSISFTKKIPPIVDIRPRNMFDIAMDNILFNVDFNSISNAADILQNMRDLFVIPIRTVTLLEGTRQLLETNYIFWTGTRFSLLPDQPLLVQHYFGILPEEIRAVSMDIYTHELTNVNSTLKILKDAMSKLQLITCRFWRKTNNRQISELFKANPIYNYTLKHTPMEAF